MALTANRDVDHYIDQELRSLQVAGATHVYKGALVGLASTGYARPLVAGDRFVGLAYEEIDNSGGADGDLSVRVYTLGDFGMSLSGATAADVGRPVFASADDTLTFSGGGNSYVGIAQDVPQSGQIILRLDPEGGRIETVSYAVENLAAGVDIGSRAIHAFDRDGWITAARIVNQETAATGIDNTNPSTVSVSVGAGTVASKTYNATTPFPGTNTSDDLGTISNARVAKGDVLTLSVINGTSANPGPFLVQVDWV